MTIPITLSWWLLPLSATLVFFFIAYRMMPKDMKQYGSRAPWGNAVVEIFLYGLATIASAIVWIIYLVILVSTK